LSIERWDDGKKEVRRRRPVSSSFSIQVIFDINAYGSFNVSASEKTISKSYRIPIAANDMERLLQEEIERMVSETEKYMAGDEAVMSCIAAKNSHESHNCNFRNSMTLR
jgi:molecular chaperone DnaK (HSP70)